MRYIKADTQILALEAHNPPLQQHRTVRDWPIPEDAWLTGHVAEGHSIWPKGTRLIKISLPRSTKCPEFYCLMDSVIDQ